MVDEAYLKSLKFSGYEIQRTILMLNITKDISRNTKAGLVLKGGTALLLCYNLPRYSTDLDYDGFSYNLDLSKNIEDGVKKSNLKVKEIITKKDTDTVKRYMLHCEEAPFDPLKIEISFRNMDYLINNKDCFSAINGINVYSINHLADFKANAFLERTTARDIYDLAFLLKKYPDAISNDLVKSCYDKFKAVGMDYYEGLMKSDEIIKKYDCESILLTLNEQLDQKITVSQRQKPVQQKKGRHL
jgi:predicted nucleotidyltransferase component of viral defense system